jgi:hypothetical protein
MNPTSEVYVEKEVDEAYKSTYKLQGPCLPREIKCRVV